MGEPFRWSDAWLLAAIETAAEGSMAELGTIVAAADWINHASMTLDELNGGLRRLIEAGFVEPGKGPGSWAVTTQGASLVATAGKGRGLGRQMEAIRKSLDAPEWSPEDALPPPEPQTFVTAIELKAAQKAYRAAARRRVPGPRA